MEPRRLQGCWSVSGLGWVESPLELVRSFVRPASLSGPRQPAITTWATVGKKPERGKRAWSKAWPGRAGERP